MFDDYLYSSLINLLHNLLVYIIGKDTFITTSITGHDTILNNMCIPYVAGQDTTHGFTTYITGHDTILNNICIPYGTGKYTTHGFTTSITGQGTILSNF